MMINDGLPFSKLNNITEPANKPRPVNNNVPPATASYTTVPATYVPSFGPGGCTPSVPFHFDSDVSDAMNIVNNLLNNNMDKNSIVTSMNDFHKVLSRMDSGELVELATNLANYVDKSDINDSMLISLQKSVLEKIRDKNNMGPNPVPVDPPVPFDISTPNVSEEEIQWAMNLENKVKHGYQPTQKETEIYQDIARRLVEDQSKTEAESGTGSATKAEMEWAKMLEEMVKGGYEPNQQEIERYQEIYTRSQTKEYLFMEVKPHIK